MIVTPEKLYEIRNHNSVNLRTLVVGRGYTADDLATSLDGLQQAAMRAMVLASNSNMSPAERLIAIKHEVKKALEGESHD